MSFKTVIFDLDGTLLDTLTDLANAVNYALKVCGYPPHTTEEIRSYVGNGIKNLIKRAMPSDKCENEQEFDVCFREFCGYYDKNMYVCTKPYDGIINLLEKLKKNGIKVAIVSNKADFAVKKLAAHFFAGLLDAAVGAREGLRLKPYSDTLDAALSEMNTSMEDAVYVGDSEVDIKTAANAGIPCISVTWGFKDREFLIKNGAECIVSDVEELFCKIFS